jgi:hypothetical protein
MAATPSLGPASRPEVLARHADYREAAEAMRRAAEAEVGLPSVVEESAGWVGLRLPDRAAAGWFVRAAIAEGVLARREEEVLYLPVPEPDAGSGFEAVTRVARLRRLWEALPRPAA